MDSPLSLLFEGDESQLSERRQERVDSTFPYNLRSDRSSEMGLRWVENETKSESTNYRYQAAQRPRHKCTVSTVEQIYLPDW